ncbi:MAG: thiamine-binding protein [Bacteroidales bacterium]|nr:thiamine-binding protein [Bacteroidales bacterium]
MSVLMEFAMFPTDKGSSVSSEVSKIIEMIRNSGHSYKLGAMGTTIETETLSEALEVLNKSYIILEPHSDRVYCSVKFDIRAGKMGRIQKKLSSIEEKIGKVEK